MAEDQQISLLNAVVTPTGADPFACVNDAETKKITLAQIVGAGTSPGSFTTGAFSDDVTLTKRLGVGGSLSSVAGIFVDGQLTPGGGVNQFGMTMQAEFDSGATSKGVGISSRVSTEVASFTMTSGRGIEILDAVKGAGSTITTLYGLWIDNQTQGGTNYAIYTGTGLVEFGDNLYLSNATGPTLLNLAATSTVPTVVPNRADPDTGVGWTSADDMSLVAGGLQAFRVANVAGTIYTNFVGLISSDTPRTNAAGPNVVNEAATNSNPTLVPNRADPDTGVGWGGTDQLCLISGGAERMRLTANSITIYELSLSGDVANSYSLINRAAGAIYTTFSPRTSDLDTGIGSAGDDILSLIAGEVEGLRLTEVGSAVAALFSGTLAWGSGGVVASSDEVLTKDAVCYVVEATVDVDIGDGACYFTIGDALAGKDLVDCHARVITAGVTGTTDIQVARYRSSWIDMLTVPITIDTGELGSEDAGTGFTIDTSNDDVVEYDVIRIDVDDTADTKAKGLIVRLTFQ